MSTKILLIEDNPDHILLTKKILEETSENYQLDSVCEAREGLDRIFQRNYDLILCDYRLPDLSALDILKRMKEKEKDLPFVVATSTGSEKIAVELMREGAYDYVVKDSSYEATLPMVIQRAIDRYNVNKEKEKLEQELRESNEKLKQMYTIKSEFTSMASHELRTPLTTIRETVSQVLDGLLGSITKEQKEFLSICLEDIDRMSRIINNLLDLSKMEAGKLELKRNPININNLVRNVALSFELKVKEKGLQLQVNISDKEMNVYADADKINQVFTNLIGNALKFTEKGHIEISAIEKGSEIECSVSDTGIGILKEELPRLFNKFQQLGCVAAASEKGTGLGLAIVKSIVELHGGKIWAESNLNEGSNFTFTLPKYNPEDALRRSIGDSIAAAKREHSEFSVIIVKLENFLEIKKELGVDKIREVFLAISKQIGNILGPDSHTNIKSENEIIVLLKCNKQGVPKIKAELKKIIKESPLESDEKPWVNFLFGYAVYPHDADSVDGLIDMAQKNLISEKEERLKKNIMIVDDEPIMVESLRRMLKQLGYSNIIEAYDGAGAFEKIKILIPDLIILDMKMPQMSGYEVIGRLKQDLQTKDIPIVIISGYAIESDKLKEYIKKKAMPIVGKPFSAEEIERCINYLL